MLRLRGAEIDLARGAVRAPDGTLTELRRQSAAVLRRLAARPGETVSKDTLHDEVWAEIAVTDDSLVQCIGEIRRALGAARDALRTVPREGYRLEIGEEPPSGAKGRRRAPILAAGAAAAVLAAALAWALGAFAPAPPPPRGPVVAVLPFANDAGDVRWGRRARGVTDEVIADLERNDWIFVYAAAATAPHAGATPQAVRAALDADFVVTGAVQAEGEQVRVTAALADAATGRQVWGESREGPANDLLSLQTGTAEALVAELAGSYTGAIARASRDRAHAKTGSLEAYDLFLLGIEHKHRFTREDLTLASDYFRRAVALDPGFAKAWVGLAISEGFICGLSMNPEEASAHADAQVAAIERAMEADPTDPTVLLEASRLYAIHGDIPAAGRAIREAVARAPNDADVLAVAAWTAPERSTIGAEAVAWADRALALNPAHPDWYMIAKGVAAFAAGDNTGAIAAFRQGSREFLDSWVYVAAAAALLGDEQTVREARGEIARLSPDFDPDVFFADWPWEPEYRRRFRTAALRAGLDGDLAAVK